MSQTQTPKPVSVRILEKEYKIACPPEEQAMLFRTADFVNQEMLALKKSGKIVGTERIAVLAALNIARRLLERGEESADALAGADESELVSRIDSVLAEMTLEK